MVALSLLREFSVGGQASVLCLKSHYRKTNKLLILYRGDKKRWMAPEAVSSMSHSSPTSHITQAAIHTHRLRSASPWCDLTHRGDCGRSCTQLLNNKNPHPSAAATHFRGSRGITACAGLDPQATWVPDTVRWNTSLLIQGAYYT